jgi:hypothetical protein
MTPIQAADPESDKPPAKVGQIVIIGNEVTRQSIILDRVPLYPGEAIRYSDLRQGETNLRRTTLFDARISVADAESASEYKDIVVELTEKPERVWILKCLNQISDMTPDAPIAAPLVSLGTSAIAECIVRVMEMLPAE